MSEAPDVALLSIRPEYADAILSGSKRVEFRRRPLATSVTHVVIYSTRPEGRVVGICRVVAQHRASPSELWSEFQHCGGIARRAFDAYFEGTREAYAIELAMPRTISPEDGVSLAELGATRPPQSFQYVRDVARGRVLEFAP